MMCSEPFLKVSGSGLAHYNPFVYQSLVFQVQHEASVEPYADIPYGFLRDEKLPVGPEEQFGVEHFGQLVERLRECILIVVVVYGLYNSLGYVYQHD